MVTTSRNGNRRELVTGLLFHRASGWMRKCFWDLRGRGDMIVNIDKDCNLPCCPVGPERQDRISSPILPLSVHENLVAEGGYQTLALLGLQVGA